MQCNIVEHERKKRLVSAELHLKSGRYQAPQAAADKASQKHDSNQKPMVPVGVEQCEIRGTNRTRYNLPLGTDVPELHFKGQCNPK
ncbi:hypothetical protein SDC9_143994 [bioreactor metagenome]|uniref:Uncharacterized protein n=1 Tax=bioreactor metagenome TaxID=1076179 RepID=A0A645E5L4_9ZZZZ